MSEQTNRDYLRFMSSLKAIEQIPVQEDDGPDGGSEEAETQGKET